MNKYFMLNGNRVESIIVADDKEATEEALRCTLVELIPENPAGIGWWYNDDGTFTPPQIEEEVETP